MRFAELPSPAVLQSKLREHPPAPGQEESSIVQIGCEGCLNAAGPFASGWLSIHKLVEIMDAAEGIPRCFVSGNFSSMGKAQPCPISEETGQPDCQHEREELRTIAQIVAANPGPDQRPPFSFTD